MSCPDCFQGTIMADYQPKGTIESIHGRTTYVAKPPVGTQPKGIIIIISDAFGMSFPNNKHLADTYASQGNFLVYLPDFMDGQPAPAWVVEIFPKVMAPGTWWNTFMLPVNIAQLMVHMIPFFLRHGFAKSMPKVQNFFEGVRATESKQMGLPIGSAGFCWGGKHTFALASGEYKTKDGSQPLCDAHFTAHPSNLTLPDDAKKVRLPLSVAAAEKDMVMTLQQAREVEAIFRVKMEKEGCRDLEVVEYMGAGHGFGVRADPGNKEVKKHADASVEQALKHYRKVFGEWKPS